MFSVDSEKGLMLNVCGNGSEISGSLKVENSFAS
jgi:hypothetical protein